ncbi:zinc-binding protein A33-like [Xyrichtys novacula]|uniref:Zinc-binding protein A33-like n=1 Tax=Xyrichtys novacula TaxID=13765 RepID=A0AAV1ET78_XYRNO|nr:zinc-binding protein A33-like [Xyrichtys novacula]
MASKLVEGLCCPVCTNIYTEPVILSCSHSFCKGCLQRWWTLKDTLACPVCRRRSSKDHPKVNLALMNLCETFLSERDAEDLCSLHSEKLKLVCLDHQQPVCLICKDSEIHANHTFRPINEAAEQHKKKLQETVKPLTEKLEVFKGLKGDFVQAEQHIKTQAQCTEMRIKEEFRKFHHFLIMEEEARLAALRREEEQKSQRMKEEISALSREIDDLSDTVTAAEDQLRAEDIPFLKNYKSAVERVQQRPPLKDPQLPIGALIDQAKHLGNLGVKIWTRMKDLLSYSPVILDPNTSHPNLTLSDDLTCVSLEEEEKQHPDNPERFDLLVSVVGSEGFDSGTHSWDVYVGDSINWTLGVIAESFKRKGDVLTGHWRIGLGSGQYSVRSSPNPEIVIMVQGKLQRVRVSLDWDRGTLSFSDPDGNRLIHTFKYRFTERLFPFFNTEDKLPLKILQLKMGVKINKSSL